MAEPTMDLELRCGEDGYGMSIGPQCAVVEVAAGGEAADAGVLVGSTITALQGTPVSTKAELLGVLAARACTSCCFTIRPPAQSRTESRTEEVVVSAAEAEELRLLIIQFRGTVAREQLDPVTPPPALLSLLSRDEFAVCDGGCGLGALELAEEQKHQVATDCRVACQLGFSHAGGAAAPAASAAMVKITAALEMEIRQAAFFIDPEPWVEMSGALLESGQRPLLGMEWRWRVLCALLATFTVGGKFDARERTLLRTLARCYGVSWKKVESAFHCHTSSEARVAQPPPTEPVPTGMAWSKVRAAEILRLEQMAAAAKQAQVTADPAAEEPGWTRGLKIGAAAVAGGAALFFTGGLAAPAVAGVFGLVGAGGVLAAVGGTTFVASMFGAAGAGDCRATSATGWA